MTSNTNWLCKLVVLTFTATMLVAEGTATAQPLEETRFIVGTSFGKQFVKDAVWNELDFTIFEEKGTFEANYELTTDTAFDGGFAYRAWKRLGLGFEISRFSKSITASLKAEVPHPFFFSFPRHTTGLASGINRSELDFHLQAQYWRVIGDKLLVRGSIGPTIFNVSHDLVSEITTQERGVDFTEVDIVGYETITSSNRSLGFNVGLDISYFILKPVGLGLVVRYSRGTSDVRFKGRSQPGLELGGTHLAGGIRVAF